MYYYATCCRLLYLKYSHMTPKSLLPTKSLFRPPHSQTFQFSIIFLFLKKSAHLHKGV